ncbi:hypothetical protein M0R04_07400 [Candidatus Dojkabacteria bacterium]|jgi:hypothetical protein|nr:hypothetical protein [Candidatus Dojkabacteria bacterium]
MGKVKKGTTEKKYVAPKITKAKQPVRMYDGKKVLSTMYDGPHGKYMAATIDGKLVLTKTGKPYCYKDLGKLVQG